MTHSEIHTFNDMPLKRIAKIYGVSYKMLWRRVKVSKMSIEDAIKKPPKKAFEGCSFPGCDGKHEAKGFCKMHYTQLIRHGHTTNRKKNPKGSGWLDRRGYKYINDRPEHILIAEKALGKNLPKGAVVHHIDGDVSNNSRENLLICPSQAYHMLIHRRQRAMDDSGNPDYLLCIYCGKYDDPSKLYTYKTSSFHRECRNKKQRDKRREK